MGQSRPRVFALRVFAAGMLSAGAGACALVPTLDGDLVAMAPPAVAVSPLAPPPRAEPEVRVPRQIAREVGDIYSSPVLERRLAAIVTRLSPFSERADLRYSVTILDSPAVNAFALGDGQLFVTRGLLALANDTAEVAAVIAHEMGHVSARHAAARSEQAETALLVQRVVADVTRDRRAAERTLATSAMSLASFSRAQELEADRIGIRTLMRAGFDPFGAVRFLEGMDRYLALQGSLAPGADPDGILATHPTTPERLAAALSEARLQIETGERGEVERDAWLGAIDGLVYGDDPRRGVVRGRSYLHPTLRFAFEAPPGFRLENTLRAVIGTGPDGQALRFDTVRVPAGMSLERALAESATAEFALDAIEAREIEGLPAAVAVGRSPGWTFRIALVRRGSEVYRFIFAVGSLTAEADRAFLAAIDSFRRVSPDQAEAVRALRIGLVTAAPTDTIATLSARMAVEDRRTERFLALNGLDAFGEIEPGRRYKIVRE